MPGKAQGERAALNPLLQESSSLTTFGGASALRCPSAEPVLAIPAALPPRAPGDFTRVEGPEDIPGENPALQVPRLESLMWDPSPGAGWAGQTDSGMDMPMQDSNKGLKRTPTQADVLCLGEEPSATFPIILWDVLLLTSMFSGIRPFLRQ